MCLVHRLFFSSQVWSGGPPKHRPRLVIMEHFFLPLYFVCTHLCLCTTVALYSTRVVLTTLSLTVQCDKVASDLAVNWRYWLLSVCEKKAQHLLQMQKCTIILFSPAAVRCKWLKVASLQNFILSSPIFFRWDIIFIHLWYDHHTHWKTSVFQAACITQQSCTLAVTHGTPIQLEDLTEDNGLQ